MFPQVIVCSVSDTFLKGTTSIKLLEKIRGLAPNAFCLMTADDKTGAEALAGLGAGHVTVPGRLAGADMFDVLRERL